MYFYKLLFTFCSSRRLRRRSRCLRSAAWRQCICIAFAAAASELLLRSSGSSGRGGGSGWGSGWGSGRGGGVHLEHAGDNVGGGDALGALRPDHAQTQLARRPVVVRSARRHLQHAACSGSSSSSSNNQSVSWPSSRSTSRPLGAAAAVAVAAVTHAKSYYTLAANSGFCMS